MAFFIFPVTAWESILSNLENLTDIRNAFKAYPELEREGVLRSTRHLWLFEQVLPLIYTHLTKTEVLSSRQVCWKWSLAVDTFLEESPSRAAFQSEEKQLQLQSITPSSSPGRIYCGDGHYFMGPVLDDTVTMIRFLQLMDDHPQQRNPFVGRHIRIDSGNVSSAEEFHGLWSLAVELLKKFGRHVWFLDLCFFNIGLDDRATCRHVKNVLHCVPNLKGLSIMYPHGCEDNQWTAFKRDSAFPPLSKLEVLEFGSNVEVDCLQHLFKLDQFAQLRTLHMDCANWRPCYSNNVPNLKELILSDCKSLAKLTDLLTSLNAPKLINLKLYLDKAGIGTGFDLDTYIISWLKLVPTVESVFIHNRLIRLGTTSTFSKDDWIPSVKSLTFTGYSHIPEVNFSILQCFPELENLKFVAAHADSEYNSNEGVSVYDMDVWGYSPRLKKIEMEAYISKKVFRYDRSQYERRKGK